MDCINSWARAPVPITPTVILSLGDAWEAWAAAVSAAPAWIKFRRVMQTIIAAAAADCPHRSACRDAPSSCSSGPRRLESNCLNGDGFDLRRLDAYLSLRKI